MTRRTVTERDAEAYIDLLKARFKSWFDAGDWPEPKAVENWDGNGHWGICWEEGPFEWAYYASMDSFGYEEREPEFGITLPIVEVPAKLSHIFSEPYYSFVLVLYLED